MARSTPLRLNKGDDELQDARGTHVSTEPKRIAGPRSGWLGSATFVDLLNPSDYLHAFPPQPIRRAVAKCDLVAGHGRGFSKHAWDGLNEPWQWIVKAPARRQLLRSRSIDVVTKPINY